MSSASVVRRIQSPDHLRRVEIYRRDNGTFGFSALRWDEEVACFVPFGRYAESFSDSLDRAVAEASGRVEWLAEAVRTGAAIEVTDQVT
jgi:hypothetical protein